MNRNELLLRHGRWAIGIGGILALYISLTMFWRIPYPEWLAFHHILIIYSLLLTTLAGYQHRALQFPFGFMVVSIVQFFAVLMFFYIGSYVLTTHLFAENMVWIPFFYEDYNLHDFGSVLDYLHYKDNEAQLLKLQVFSFLMSYVLYFTSGSLGYGVGAMVHRVRKRR